jgi:putative DNA primase/helicase
MRVISNGGYSKSVVHDRLMAKWRRSTNSLEEFVHECCLTGDPNFSILRSDLYVNYTAWCRENGRRAFAKGHVKELLAAVSDT